MKITTKQQIPIIAFLALFFLSSLVYATPSIQDSKTSVSGAQNATNSNPAPPAPIPAPPASIPAPPAPNSTSDDLAKKQENLKKECDKLKKQGKKLTEECKAAAINIVFQGAVRRDSVHLKVLPQAVDEESQSIKADENKENIETFVTDSGKVDIWKIAAREPVLFPDAKLKQMSVGAQAGYPIAISRGTNVAESYNSIVSLAADLMYQATSLFKIGIVSDVHILNGSTSHGKEFMDTRYYTDAAAGEHQDIRYSRDVGARLNAWIGIGLRPTFRMNFKLKDFEIITGVGFGWHLFHTSGRWRTKLPEEDRAISNSVTSAQWTGDDEAIYVFSTTDSGMYYVFENMLLYRFANDRMGAGIMLKYMTPIQGVVKVDVDIEQPYGLGDSSSSAFREGYSTQENDYGDTFIRQLSSIKFLTVGAMFDYRF